MKAPPSLGTSQATAPTSSSTPNSLVSSTTPPAQDDRNPTDLILATPPTLLRLFALVAPAIHATATLAQLLTWQHPSFFGSLLTLLAWWGICLFGYPAAKYGLNALVLLALARKYLTTARRTASPASAPPSSLRHRTRPATLSPAAYAQLINSATILVTHVQALRSSILHPLSLHFSFVPLRPSTPAPAYETAWLLLTSYPFYLALTWVIPLRYLFLLAGSVAILWQAPFFTTLRLLVWRSAFVRWAARLALGVLKGGRGVREEWARTRSGLGIAGLIGKQDGAAAGRAGRSKDAQGAEEKAVKKAAARSALAGPAAAAKEGAAVSPAVGTSPATSDAAAAAAAQVVATDEAEEDAALEAEKEGEDVQVQFTVFENQRWWVGLDWTHALLPGERASWTDPAGNPANPPSSFSLPPPSVAYIPSPTKSDPHSRLKKTTAWRWLDPEWHVLRSAIPSVALPILTPPPGGVAGAAPGSAPDGSDTTTGGAAPPSPPQPPAQPASPTISRIAAAAGVNLPPSLLPSASVEPPTSTPSFLTPSAASLAWDEHSPLFAAWIVDDEGWQYGDNHFEKMGPKGGLGKYTRRRAWVRRAGLVETTERVSSEPAATAAVGEKVLPVPAAGGEKKDGEGKKAAPPPLPARRASLHGSEATELVRRSSSRGGTDGVRRRKSSVPPVATDGGGGGGEKA
ncbi:hypothetical protein JCM8097_002505 [Rhodosporidiobolus ruineniae]